VSRRAWIVFCLTSLIWGSSFLLIKVAVEDVSPWVVAPARTGLGAAVLLPVAVSTNALQGLRGRIGAIVALAALDVAGGTRAPCSARARCCSARSATGRRRCSTSAASRTRGRSGSSRSRSASVNTGVAFWLIYTLIAAAGAARASVITYVMPAVAVVLGILVLSEPFAPGTALGLALILGGTALSTAREERRASGRRRAAVADAPTGRG